MAPFKRLGHDPEQRAGEHLPALPHQHEPERDRERCDPALVFGQTAGPGQVIAAPAINGTGGLNGNPPAFHQAMIRGMRVTIPGRTARSRTLPLRSVLLSDSRLWGCPDGRTERLCRQLPDHPGEQRRRHTTTGPTLGAARDVEADGQPTANADGDDLNGVPDDEDGVTIPTLTQAQAAALTVNVSAFARLDAWIDWNRDGDWADAGEKVASNQAMNAGNNTLNVNVPAAPAWVQATPASG